jgi:phosphoribosylanthranilate isomerase
VGVFVNIPPEEIRLILSDCRLDLAQLSGDERLSCIQELENQAYKAIRPKNMVDAIDQGYFYAQRASAPSLLIDAYRPGHYGGTGQTGDWSLAQALSMRYPILLAGGLTPQNVAWALKQVRPWGVDVASGVESAPGCKDPEKMTAFVRAVREFSAVFED